MTLAERVGRVLDHAGVTHALIGAAALAAAGVVRSTLDIDLLTLDARVLDSSFWSGLVADRVDVDVRRGDVDDPLVGIVRASAAGERPVDLIVGRYRWQQRALDRARLLPSRQRVVLPRDLVLLKLYAGGTQDQWDIARLLETMDGESLAAEVEQDLHDLPPAAVRLWRTVRSRA